MLTISLYQQRRNYLLTLGFALGGVALSVVLLAKGGFAWGKFETVISILVLASLAVWKFSGPRNATIAVTAAICAAGIPGLVEMARKPQSQAGKVWAGYVLANGLSFFGGTAMMVEERLAPGAFTVLSVLMLAASRRARNSH
jgi:hypothetical protein